MGEDKDTRTRQSNCSSDFSDISSDVDIFGEDETPTEEFLSNSMPPTATPTPMSQSRKPSVKPETSKAQWSWADPNAKETATLTAPAAKSLFPKPKKTYTLGDPMS